MSAVEVQSEENQPMSLKVMRLTAPSFNFQSEHFLEASDTPDALFLKAFQKDTDLRYGICELNPSLSVPTPLSTIYLGETFSSYICVNNETDSVLQHMTLKVELQATYRHFSLIDTTITPQDIGPKRASQFITHHEVKELGMHFLLCSVHYLTPSQERKFFKKIYKVNVLNPLAVKTKCTNLRFGGIVLLEVQIHNLSNLNMFLESLKFVPSEFFSFEDLNFVISAEPARLNKQKSIPKVDISQAPKTDVLSESSFQGSEITTLGPDEHLSKISSLEKDLKQDAASYITNEQEENVKGSNGSIQDVFNNAILQEMEKSVEPSIAQERQYPLDVVHPVSEYDISENPESENSINQTEKEAQDEKLGGPKNFATQQLSSTKGNVCPELNHNRIEVFGPVNYLKPTETRQYLYKLIPKDVTCNEAYTASELGKLDIVWRSSFCSVGRLQTSQLTRRPPPLELVELRAVSIPELILVEVPFPVICRVQNRSKSEMHLKVVADRTKVGSLLFSGVSPLDLGPIGPGHAFTFKLEFMPLTSGPHKLGGLKIIDLTSKLSHEIETLAEVFVQRHDQI